MSAGRLWTIEEALASVEREAGRSLEVRRPLAECLGTRLVEDVHADMDSPPFDKALVDGYALRGAGREADGRRWWRVVEEVDAGRVPARGLEDGESGLVMTGAPVPAGSEAVVMHEETERVGEEVSLPLARTLRAGEGILPRGREYRAGDRVLAAGDWIDPTRLGLLAAVGTVAPRVNPRPRVAIVATGDELVDAGQVPGGGQIRNSNSELLRGLVESVGGIARVLGIRRDDEESLANLLGSGLDSGIADVLVVSGGVSAGRRDLVPGILERLGVRTVFHKVRLRPGKPVLFGVGPERGEGGPGLVFGLPGNPVSSLVCFLLFVAPALRRLSGGVTRGIEIQRGRLSQAYQHRGERPAFHPSLVENRAGTELSVTPLPWAGSPDLWTVARSDGFARFPAGDALYGEGEVVDVFRVPGRGS